MSRLKGLILVICLGVTMPCLAAKKLHKKVGSSESAQLHWESYTDAVSRAKKEGKYVCLFFTGSDWCIWCMKMQQQILSSSEFMQFANAELCMVEVDFPQKKPIEDSLRQQNRQLKSQFDVTGFPTLVFINGNEEEVLRDGFRHGGGKAYVDQLRASLKAKKKF